MKKEFVNIVPNKLLDELSIKGIAFKEYLSGFDGDGNSVVGNASCIFADGTDMDLVQSIVDAHDATPKLPAPNDTEILTNYILDVDMRLVMVEMGIL